MISLCNILVILLWGYLRLIESFAPRSVKGSNGKLEGTIYRKALFVCDSFLSFQFTIKDRNYI